MSKISNGTAEGLLKAMFRVCSSSEALVGKDNNFWKYQLEPLVYKANFIKNR
jgi:hypothetical protein